MPSKFFLVIVNLFRQKRTNTSTLGKTKFSFEKETSPSDATLDDGLGSVEPSITTTSSKTAIAASDANTKPVVVAECRAKHIELDELAAV
jgi:hypothetical protein